jgi:Peptidase family M48
MKTTLAVFAMLSTMSMADEHTDLQGTLDAVVKFDHPQGDTVIYQLEYADIKGIADSQLYRGFFKTSCRIRVNPTQADMLEQDALTFMLAHEVAHCSMGHTNYLRALSMQTKNPSWWLQQQHWKVEYEADQRASIATRLLGHDPIAALDHLIINDPGSFTHPPKSLRLMALNSGHRYYPDIVKVSYADYR